MTPERALHHALMVALANGEAPLGAGPLVAAVSGGRDSTALAIGLASLRDRGLLTGHEVILAHVDHGLHERRRQAAEFVRDLAERLGLAHAERQLTPSSNASEETLRDLRFAALEELVEERRAAALLTAHHADDDLETVLLRVARGTGRRGLAGIPRRRELPGGRPLLRPLLDLPRRVLAEVVDRAGVEPVDDPSNGDRRRARNALRLDELDRLRHRHGRDFEARLLTLARAARRRATWSSRQARAWLQQHHRPQGPRSTLLAATPAEIPTEALRLVHRGLCGQDPTPRWLERVAALARSGAICAGGGPLQAERCRRGLLLGAPPDPNPTPPIRLELDGRWHDFGLDGWQLRSSLDRRGPDQGRMRVIIDPARIALPLSVRTALAGERIEQRSGSRSIRALMQRDAIPSLDRPRWPLLVDADDRPLWLPGVACDPRLEPPARSDRHPELQARRVGGGIPRDSSPY